jgi:fibronectin type 3 domain-containing protein
MKKLTTSLLLIGSLLIFSGCEKTLETPSQEPKIDLNLPVVDTESIRTVSDYKSIALEWKSISDASVFGYYVYRSNKQIDDSSLKRVAAIENKYQTHYVDSGLTENSKYEYSISTMGKEDYESTPTNPVAVSTLPNLEAISLVETVSGLPRQVKVLWRPHPNPRVGKYIVQRASPTEPEWERVAVNKGRFNIEFIDQDLGDNEIFKYRVIARTFDNVSSLPSKIVRATTKPLPKNVTSLKATDSLPREIKLTWQRSETGDAVSYNIYKSSSVDGSYSKIASAPIEHDTFSEKMKEDGVIYFYKISTVDKDGLESNIENFQAVMGRTLQKPATPQITLSQIKENASILNWYAGDDRAVSYNIYKKRIETWSSSEEKMIPGVIGLRFEDPDIVRGVEYEYSIQAVDKHGLVSKKTAPTTLKLAEIKKQD